MRDLSRMNPTNPITHNPMQEVMKDFRAKGARCIVIAYKNQQGHWDYTIRARLKDGRLWDIIDIESTQEVSDERD